jgi:hypothetical protein
MQDYIHELCSGALVAALILYSDQTCLSFDRRISGWSFVLTLANIPRAKRREPDGHVLLGIFPVLKAVSGCPGQMYIRSVFSFDPLDDWSFDLRASYVTSLTHWFNLCAQWEFCSLTTILHMGVSRLLYSGVCALSYVLDYGVSRS